MAKHMMWGIAAVAAGVVGTLAVTGWPPVRGGIAGDITQAKRYQAQQLTNKDAVLEDTEAHRFIQSDLFDRLLKDDAVRQVLANPNVRVQLFDPRVFAAAGDGQLQRVFDDPAVRKALDDPAVARALARPAFQAALSSPGFRAALQDLHFAQAMAKIALNSPIVDGAVIVTPAF